MSKQPPSEWVEVADQMLKGLGAERVLIERGEGWEFISTDGSAFTDDHHMGFSITVYKGGKTYRTGSGGTLKGAVDAVMKRRDKDPEED